MNIRMENRDKYKRKSAIITYATENQLLNQLLIKNYTDLYEILVKTEEDKDIFQDTYLNLTRTYQPSLEFMDEFCRQFNMIKTRYIKTDRGTNFLIESFDNANSKEAKQV